MKFNKKVFFYFDIQQKNTEKQNKIHIGGEKI